MCEQSGDPYPTAVGAWRHKDWRDDASVYLHLVLIHVGTGKGAYTAECLTSQSQLTTTPV